MPEPRDWKRFLAGLPGTTKGRLAVIDKTLKIMEQTSDRDELHPHDLAWLDND